MTAWEFRRHLEDTHGQPTRGLDYGQMGVLHWDAHTIGADHEHQAEEDAVDDESVRESLAGPPRRRVTLEQAKAELGLPPQDAR